MSHTFSGDCNAPQGSPAHLASLENCPGLPAEDPPAEGPQPAPSWRLACAEILGQVWHKKDVAEALGVARRTLDYWGVRGLPTPERRLKDRLLATGASASDVARLLGLPRQGIAKGPPAPLAAPEVWRPACARILCEVWQKRVVAAALKVPVGALAEWDVPDEAPLQQLRGRLLETGAPPAQVGRMLAGGWKGVDRGQR